MQKCPNCSATLTCGCQRRVASDGKNVCTNCHTLYEKQLIEKRNRKNMESITPMINNVTLTKDTADLAQS